MLLVHIGIASMRQFKCAPTTYVHSINECFHHKTGSQTYQLLFMYQCNGHVEMNNGMHLDDNNRQLILYY